MMSSKQTQDEEVIASVSLKTKVEELENLLITEQEKAIRALADLENVKRREMQSRAKWGDMAIVEFINKLLPSLLELHKGTEHSQDKALVSVVEKLFKSLEKSGLHPIAPSKKTPINPSEHEVLLTAEGKKGCVVQTLEFGWKFNDLIICPAKVSACPN